MKNRLCDEMIENVSIMMIMDSITIATSSFFMAGNDCRMTALTLTTHSSNDVVIKAGVGFPAGM